MSAYDYEIGNPRGAFKTSYINPVDTLANGNGIGKWIQYDFNAFYLNPVYGASDTVTPLSLSTQLILKY